VTRHFGPEDAPKVEIVDELSANALATATRTGAPGAHHWRDAPSCSTTKLIHVLTAVNGRHQPTCPSTLHLGPPARRKGLAVPPSRLGTPSSTARRLATGLVQILRRATSQRSAGSGALARPYRPSRAPAASSARAGHRWRPFTMTAYLSGFLAVSTFIKPPSSRAPDCVGTRSSASSTARHPCPGRAAGSACARPGPPAGLTRAGAHLADVQTFHNAIDPPRVRRDKTSRPAPHRFDEPGYRGGRQAEDADGPFGQLSIAGGARRG
jgi:hypothetical protein